MPSPAPRYRALLLDAMGTLVRLDPPGPRLRRELRARFGLELTPDEAEAAMRSEIAYYRAHMHAAHDGPAVERLRHGAAEALRAGLPDGRRLPAVATDQLLQALLTALHFSAYPDAAAAIDGARARGLRVVVASNWDAALGEVLERVGLAGRLDGVVTSAGAGAAKPARAVFAAALARAGARADEALHVGDSLREDVAGARAAGITAVWLDRVGAGHAEDRDPPLDPAPLTLRSLAGLSDLL